MGILTSIFMVISLLLVLCLMYFGFKGIAGPRRNPRDEAPGERTIYRQMKKNYQPGEDSDDSQRAA